MNRDGLIEARATALKKMKEIAASENFKQEDFDKAKTEVDSISAQIKTLDIENELSNQVEPVIAEGNHRKPEEKAQLNALMAYARTGVIDAQNAVTIGGSSNGAVLIPQTYADSILTDLKNNVAMRKFATVRKTSGTFNMPIGGATPAFSWIDEGGTYPTPDLSFTNKTLEAYKAGGIILVAEELLEDDGFDLVTHLKEQIVDGIAEGENTAFISGDGTKKPTGITVDIDAGLTETLATLDTLAVTDIEDTYLAVPAKARKNGKWIISDKFYKAAFRMKDSTGNYIMREGQGGDISTLFGRPFEVDDTMAGGAGEPLAIFGKLEDYVIGDRGEMAIQRLDEKYSDEGYIGFKVYKRTDGKLSRNKYVSQLVNAAS